MDKTKPFWLKRFFAQPESVTLLIICTLLIIIFKVMSKALTPLIVSIMLAYLLLGLVKKLEQLHLPHLVAVSIIFLFFISALLLACLWLLPMLWYELVELATEIPNMLNRSQSVVVKLHELFPDLISVSQLQQLVSKIAAYLANFGKEIVTLSLASLFGIVSIIIYLILVPFLVFFFLRDGKQIINWFTAFLPKKSLILQSVWYEMHDKIRCYIQGKVIEIAIVATTTIIAFSILRLHYAILLGFLVGLSVLVPYIGVTVVTIPVILVGIIQWGLTNHFFYLVLIYSIITILDANLLVPILFSGAMNLHPLAIILSVLLFGNLFGFWGVFFAIPLTTLANLIIKTWQTLAISD